MKNLRLKSKIYELFETQSDFAQSLGVREDRVSRIIHGRAVATEEEKQAIGRTLAVSPDKFLLLPTELSLLFRLWLLQLLIPADDYFEPGLSMGLDKALQDLKGSC